MSEKFKIDGVEYDRQDLTDEGQKNLAAYRYANKRLREAVNMKAVLTRARNSYILELKTEIVKGKTGVDLNDLLSND